MAFPINPNPGDTYTDDYGTVWVYAGPVNGWYRKTVNPTNNTTYIGSDGAPGGVSNDTEVVFNANGSLASDGGLTYNKTTDALSGGAFVPTGSTVPANGVYLPSANNVAISTNGTGRLFVDASGNVGVGTTSPDYLLTVGSSSGATSTPTAIKLDSTYSNSPASRDKLKFYLYKGATEAYGFTVADGSDLQYWAGSNSTGVHRWFTSGTERFRIDSSGRLLVGTSSTTNTNLRAIFQGTPASSTGTGYLYLSMGRSNPTSGQELGALAFSDNGHVSSASIIGVHDGGTWTSGSSQPTRLVFSTTADGSASPTERMRIDSSGRVGIGVTSPNVPLHIYHPTTNGVATFESGDADALINFKDNTTTNSPSVGATGNDFKIITSSTERLRIDSSGRLLVGTSTSASIATREASIQIASTELAPNVLSGLNTNASEYGPSIVLAKSRGGESPAVISDDTLGSIIFAGHDGTDLTTAGAYITAKVDGAVSNDDLPTRLVFFTTADGASSPTERVRIDSDGVYCYRQAAPIEKTTAVTLTAAELKTGIIVHTVATNTQLTLPTGTDIEAAFSGLYNDMTFNVSIVAAGAGSSQIQGNTGITIVGLATVVNAGTFAVRRTSTNTYVAYRIG